MKNSIRIFIVFTIVGIALYFSYQPKPDINSYSDFNHQLSLPFDTARVLGMMKIVDSVNEVAVYYNEPDKSLYPKIDTLDLIWTGPGTDCPEWRYADSTDENFSILKDFYIEPANEKLNLPDHIMRTRIQFIGREYGGISFPKDFAPYTSSPHAGRVFKYYAYKIYKPFTVYGPEVESKTINDFELTHLHVK